MPTNPHVTFDADGTSIGTDGCNTFGSRWAIGDGGRLLTRSGASSLIGCDGAPIPQWVATAQRAGIDRATLVLLARDGTELGRLARG